MKKTLFILLLPFIFFGCEKNEENEIIIQSSATVYCGDTISIPITAPLDYSVEFNNNYINTIKKNNEILIIGKKVGVSNLTLISNDETKNCKIECKGKYNFYQEPYFLFGENKYTVQAHEFRTIYQEQENALFYLGENNNIGMCYYGFQNNSLEGTVTIHPILSSSNVSKQIIERYLIIGQEENTFYFVSPDSKIIGSIEMNIDCVTVINMKNPNTKSNNNIINTLKEFSENNKSIIYKP